MPDNSDTKVLQVLRRQVGQDLLADCILTECRLILFKAKLPQPTSDVDGGAPWFANRRMIPQGGLSV